MYGSINDSFDDSIVDFNSLAIIDSYIKESAQSISFDEAMRGMPTEEYDAYLINSSEHHDANQMTELTGVNSTTSIGNQVLLYL